MLNISPEEWKSFSHKKRRQLINKERRRRKRVAEALQREEEQAALEQDAEYLEELCAEERRLAEEERRSALEEEQWRERERVAQEEFRRKREVEEKIIREREERERLIREEWESLQRKEREEEERREQAKREKEERLEEALRVGDTPLHETSWASPRWAPEASTPPHSPPTQPSHPSQAPPASQDADYGTEQDPKHCSFYLKTGACRFKERCSKLHPRPRSSTTLMLPGMFTSLGFMEQLVEDRDQDTELEYDEGEMYEQFKVFYDDVLPEFKKAGKVVQFKVSCNYEPHLRGNVYVQYSTEEECSRAFHMFNGRWYALRQLSCEYCPVQKWRSAICGLFNMKKCFKGKHCNFLHVFKNPDREFFRADRDLPPMSPPPSHPHRRHSSHTPSHHHRRHSSPPSSRWSVSRDDGHSQRSRYRSKERRRRRSTSPSPDRHSTHSHTRSRHSHSRRSLSRERGKRRHRRYSSDRNGRGSTSRKRGSDSQSSSDTSQGQRSSSGSESDSSRRRSKHSKHRHRSKKRRRRARDESESPSRSGEESLSRKRSRHKKKHRKKRHHKRDSDDELGTLVDQSVKSTPPDEDKGSSVSETVLVADQLKPCGEDEVRTISKECSSRGATELRSSACTEQVNTEALDTTQVTGTLDSTHQSEVTEQVQRSDLTAVQSSGMPDTPHAHTTLTVSTSPGKDHQSSTQTETGGCDSRAQDQSDMCTVDPGQETDRSVAHAAI